MQKTREGFTVWLTGLSGAGKSTIGMLLANELKNRGMNVEFLDGDEVRAELCQDLGFSPKDRLTNIQRVCYVTELLNRNGISVVASFITPYHSMREYCRVRIRNYTEVYVKCPLETLIQRDGKGLYKKALTGEIKNFTGVSDVYEEPESPDLVIRTDLMAPRESMDRVLVMLRKKGVST